MALCKSTVKNMKNIDFTDQNMEKPSSFKNQVGNIIKELNKFNENEKNEAVAYLKKCINLSNDSKIPTDTIEFNSNGKGRTKTTNKVNTYGTLLGQKVFKTKKEFSSIISKSVSRKTYFKCETCSKKTKTKKSMLKHVETHGGASLSCIKCRCTFNGSIPFTWHLKHYCQSAFGQSCKFKCSECPRKFKWKQTLDSHIQGHKRNNCSHYDKKVHGIKMKREFHKCTYCERRYLKKNSLYYHLKQHLPDKFICMECGYVNSTTEEHDEHKKSHDFEKLFNCTECDQKFLKRQQYLYHLKGHNQYKCVTCDESYVSRGKLTRHKQLGHIVEGLSPRFICPYCPVAYHRGDRFHIHLGKHMEEKKAVSCKYCNKTFISVHAYVKHCLTVSHEKFCSEMNDLICDKCGKHFLKNSHLKQHIHRVHNFLNQYIVCQYCDYKTAHRSNMDRHVALHFKNDKQFTCEYCGKTCDSIAGLNDHIAYNHMQKKQFKCDKCDKSFKRNSELNRHKNTHSEERPHICSLCGKSYKRLSHLTRHEQCAHQIVKESRRIRKMILKESESQVLENLSENNVKTHQNDPFFKTVLYQSHVNEEPVNHCGSMIINFPNNTAVSSSGNVMEQVTYLVTDRNWNVYTEDLYKIYNDVSLNDGNQSLF